MSTAKFDKTLDRAFKVLEIARRMARALPGSLSNAVLSRIDEIDINTSGYAEPGYSCDSGIVALGNWNTVEVCAAHGSTGLYCLAESSDLLRRVSDIFEKMGIECEWADEWSTCSTCDKLVRIQPDSYHWKAQYMFVDSYNAFLCIECLKDDPEAYFFELEGTREIGTVDLDPTEHGYVKYNDELYEMHNVNIDVVAGEIENKGIHRFIFMVESAGQFQLYWNAFVHGDEAHLLEDEDHLLEEDESPVCKAQEESPILEKACHNCGRNNDVGADECWWCGVFNPTL